MGKAPSLKALEEESGSDAQRRSARVEKAPEHGEHLSAQREIALGEVGQRLQGAGLDDAAAVVEPGGQVEPAAALGRVERQARRHLGVMPAQFLVLRRRRQPQERRLVRGEPIRMDRGNSFGDVGRAQPHDRVRIAEPRDDLGE